MGLLNTGNDKAMPTPAGSTLEKPGTLPRAKSKLVRSLIASGKNKLANRRRQNYHAWLDYADHCDSFNIQL